MTQPMPRIYLELNYDDDKMSDDPTSYQLSIEIRGWHQTLFGAKTFQQDELEELLPRLMKELSNTICSKVAERSAWDNEPYDAGAETFLSDIRAVLKSRSI